jgi:hypothetical protein
VHGTEEIFRYMVSMQQIYFSYIFNLFKKITQFLLDECVKCNITTYRPPKMGLFMVFLSPTREMPGY